MQFIYSYDSIGYALVLPNFMYNTGGTCMRTRVNSRNQRPAHDGNVNGDNDDVNVNATGNNNDIT